MDRTRITESTASPKLEALVCQSTNFSQTDDGNIYYFNFVTGESIWDHPCDEYYKTLYASESEKLHAKDGKPVETTKSKSKTKPIDDFHLDDGIDDDPPKRNRAAIPALAPLKKLAKLGPLVTTTPKVESVINKLSAKKTSGLSANNLMSRSGLMLISSSSAAGSLDVLGGEKKEGAVGRHERELDEINRAGEIQSAEAKVKWGVLVEEEKAKGKRWVFVN